MFTTISTRTLKPWKIGSQKIPSLSKAQHEQYTLEMHVFQGIQADEFSSKASLNPLRQGERQLFQDSLLNLGPFLLVPSFSQQGSAEWSSCTRSMVSEQ